MGDFRTNAGFIITNTIPVGDKEFVLGVNMKNAQSFVTWECKDKTDYFWGHYSDNLLKATKDLCQRVMEEIAYLEYIEQQRNEEPGYILAATIKYGEHYEVLKFPTKELENVLESIGITLPPEQVYLGGHSDIEVYLQHNGHPVTDAIIRLFRDNNSLHMVNEVTESVFRSDWRVYERVEEKLKTNFYVNAEHLLRDAVNYKKFMDGVMPEHKKTERGER